jgi:acyl transferase domain-containing protein
MHAARGFDVLRELANAPPPARARPASAAVLRLRHDALELARSEHLVEPAYSYDVVALDAPAAATLRARGEQILAPRLLPSSGELTALACCVCTLGSRLEERVRSLFAQQRRSLAAALDEIGNELLFAVSRRAQDRIDVEVRRTGLCLSGELRAGDPGLALDAQPAVLRLAGAAQIGVRLGERLLMHPHKSTSMILGVGIDLPPASWSRCDDCPKRTNCRAVARARAESRAA